MVMNEEVKSELRVAGATLIAHSIAKIPYLISNGFRSEIAYDIVYKLPKYVYDRILHNIKEK